MPNRILREGILTSEDVDKLGPHAEVFYRRLMSVVDDFGRYTAHPGLLRAACYPLRVECVREADISRLLAEVQEAGLIALYEIDGKRFLQMAKCDVPRAKKSKYPPPPEHLQASARRCAQTQANVPYSYSISDSSARSDSGGSLARRETFLTGPTEQTERFWQTYPKKTHRGLLQQALEAEIAEVIATRRCTDEQAFAWLLKAAQEYADSPAGKLPSSGPDVRPSPREVAVRQTLPGRPVDMGHAQRGCTTLEAEAIDQTIAERAGA